MEPTHVVVSWSGGKDSSLALAALRADPAYVVVGLLTSVTAGYDRVSIHGVRRSLLERQAAALRLPLQEVLLRPSSSDAAYAAAFRDALDVLRERLPRAREIAFGDLFLADVRAYRERLLAGTGYAPAFPLWGTDTRRLATRFVDDGFAARLVCVDTTQLDAAFAGRPFDRELLAALPDGVDPCGERGEFHTFVADGPIFAEPVGYEVGETVLREGRFAYCDLLPVAEQGVAAVGRESER
jgi:uncharacterized protein (TIGR00290 family)